MEIINSAQSDSPPPALVISRLHVVGEIFNYEHSHSDFAINCPTPSKAPTSLRVVQWRRASARELNVFT